jgi:LysM repeat protein
MNNSNPFVPKGSILEQQSKRRSRLKLAVFCILAVSVTGLSVMLIQGCKREVPVENQDTMTPTIDTNPPVINETNPPVIDTNPPVYLPPVETNPPTTYSPPPTSPSASEYTVVKGDYLEKIAKKFGVTVKAIEAANPGIVPTKLKIGQKLNIPAGSNPSPSGVNSTGAGEAGEVYVVKSGDSLWKIANLHGTTVKALQTENNLPTTSIKVGQKLKVPAKAGTAAPVAPVAPASVPETTPPAVMPETVPGQK